MVRAGALGMGELQVLAQRRAPNREPGHLRVLLYLSRTSLFDHSASAGLRNEGFHSVPPPELSSSAGRKLVPETQGHAVLIWTSPSSWKPQPAGTSSWPSVFPKRPCPGITPPLCLQVAATPGIRSPAPCDPRLLTQPTNHCTSLKLLPPASRPAAPC